MGRSAGGKNQPGHKAGGFRKKYINPRDQTTLDSFATNSSGASTACLVEPPLVDVEGGVIAERRANCDEGVISVEEDLEEVVHTTEQELSRDEGEDNEEEDRVPYLIQDYLFEIQDMLKKEMQMQKTISAIAQGRLWIEPPDPVVLGSHVVDPKAWVYPKVFLWFPRVMRPNLKMPCPECHQSNTVVHEWPQNPPARRVAAVVQNYYIISRRYKCLDCEKRRNSGIPGTEQIQYTFMPYNAD